MAASCRLPLEGPNMLYCTIYESPTVVIQHNVYGDFNRSWVDYKEGFGNVDGDYWMGNDAIHNMTSQTSYKMRIDLKKFDGDTAFAEYDSFWIEDEAHNYVLHLGSYFGTAGSMAYTIFHRLCICSLILMSKIWIGTASEISGESISISPKKVIYALNSLLCVFACDDAEDMCKSVRYHFMEQRCDMYNVTAENIPLSTYTSRKSWIDIDKLQGGIKDEAKNPCANDLCNNNGWCVALSRETYSCTCRFGGGFTGKNCEIPVTSIINIWSTWGHWSDCSTTIGIGYQERKRHYILKHEGLTLEESSDLGHPVEFKKCYFNETKEFTTIIAVPRLHGNGGMSGNGTLQLFIEWFGGWIGVNGLAWNFNDANIACKHLGFPGAISGWATNVITSQNEAACSVKCNGTELSLDQCEITLTSRIHDVYAGVTCFSQDEWGSWTSWTQHCSNERRTRPCLGGNNCSGTSEEYRLVHPLVKNEPGIVIQRNVYGDFNRSWDDFKRGFGNINGDYWMGNDAIHNLTSQASYKMRIDLEKFDGDTAFAEYDSFWIEDEVHNYVLHLGSYSGTAGNAIINHAGQAFTTIDRDNDGSPDWNCAKFRFGGWWYKRSDILLKRSGVFVTVDLCKLDLDAKRALKDVMNSAYKNAGQGHYEIHTDKKAVRDAALFCMDQDMMLVDLANETVLSALQDAMSALGLLGELLMVGERMVKNDVVTLSGEIRTYRPFSSGEPSGDGDCLFLWQSVTALNDMSCTIPTVFACEPQDAAMKQMIKTLDTLDLNTVKASFDSAVSACTNKGMNLVKDTSIYTHMSLKNFLMFENFESYDGWIDLRNVDGNWVHSDGQTGSYQCWSLYNPDGSGQCAHLWNAVRQEWDDTECSYVVEYICQGDPCDEPPLTESVIKIGYAPYSYLDNVTLECNYGYYNMTGKDTAMCQGKHEQWTELPICAPDTCDSPVIPPSSYIVENITLPLKHGDTITIGCDDGFYLVGQDSSTCAYGNWVPNNMECYIYTCDAPTAPNNSQSLGSYDIFLHQDVIYFECNDGYYLSGENSSTCAYGEWVPSELETCSIYTCDRPPTPDNGFLVEDNNKQDFEHLDVVHFECFEDYYLAGNDSVLCKYGKWAIEYMGQCLLDISSQSIAIEENYLQAGEMYMLGVSGAIQQNGKHNMTMFTLLVNELPSGGSCSIQPTSGFVLQTGFVVTCIDWKDEGNASSMEGVSDPAPGTNSPGLIVDIRMRDKGSVVQPELVYSSQQTESPPLYLRSGKAEANYEVDVVVSVLDSYGGASHETILSIQVMEGNLEDIIVDVMAHIETGGGVFGQLKTQDPLLAVSYLGTVASYFEFESNSTDDYSRGDEQDIATVQQTRSSLINALFDLASVEYVFDSQSGIEQIAGVVASVTSFRHPEELTLDTQAKAATIAMKSAHALLESADESINSMVLDIGKELILASNNIILASLYSRELNTDIDDGDTMRITITNAMNALDAVCDAALTMVLPGAGPTEYGTDILHVVLSKISPNDLNGLAFNSEAGGFRLPESEMFDDLESTPVSTKFLSMSNNPYISTEEDPLDDSPIVGLELIHQNHQLALNGGRILIDVTNNNDAKTTNETTKEHQYEISEAHDLVFSFNLSVGPGSVVLKFLPDYDGPLIYNIYMGFEFMPTAMTYDVNKTFSSLQPKDVVLSTEDAGVYYVLVVLEFTTYNIENALSTLGLNNETSTNDVLQTTSTMFTGGRGVDELSIDGHNGTVIMRVAFCRYWNTTDEEWQSNGCSVASYITSDSITCSCNHLTSFSAADFVVPVNKIDFSTVFTKNILDNSVVLIVILAFFLIYVILTIYMRKKDKDDLIRWTVWPLAGNNPRDNYIYQLTVYTSMVPTSGTKSKIQFTLTGDDGESGVRDLIDKKSRVCFSSGSVVSLYLTVPKSLGELRYIRIWHDNSPKDNDDASWYLNRVVVFDLQSERRFDFTCYDWLAVDKSDGQILRLLPVSGDLQLSSFKNILSNKMREGFSEDYMWGSVWLRPTPSNFTRVQRLGCCIVFIYLSMITNAMFYDTGGEGGTAERISETKTISIGPFRFSLGTIYISLICSLVSTPPSALIQTLFEKARPRESKNDSSSNSDGGDVPSKEKKQEKDDMWPWWCVIFAWILVFASIVIPAFFTVLYSLQWGKETSLQWLTAEITSIVLSAFIVEPLQATALSMAISAVYSKLNKSYSDEQNPEEKDTLKKEEHEENHRTNEIHIKGSLSNEELQNERGQRLTERRMSAVIEDFVFCLILLLVITVIASAYRNIDLYYAGRNIRDTLAPQPDNDVTTPSKYWQWMSETVIEAIFPDSLYNGKPISEKQGSLTLFGNLVSYTVGPVVLRQLRVTEGGCSIPLEIEDAAYKCHAKYSRDNEDTRAYNVSWTSYKDTNLTQRSPWIHSKILGLPVSSVDVTSSDGTVYNNEGYMAIFGRPGDAAMELSMSLQSSGWIDQRTRAVFLEFIVYNGNENIFSFVTYLTEFKESGIVRKSWRVDSVTCLGLNGSVTIACHVIFLLLVIYVVYRLCIRIYHGGLTFFTSFWNWWYVVLVVFLLVVVDIFFTRMSTAHLALNEIKAGLDVVRSTRDVDMCAALEERCQRVDKLLQRLETRVNIFEIYVNNMIRENMSADKVSKRKIYMS
uniref:Polycystic kidney disease protein 1-like 2-like n=1 Tax=Saccoglossus kowalevskii TaxID=10224 RepID=A0ABM0GNB3_SACKO|nr:PREDICTED: polycystic kidney disease protein 1-like 2-like [Saccoglossus kowalevskii]